MSLVPPMRRDKESTSVPVRIERELARMLPAWRDARLCVALSGGVDSVALLAACADLRTSHAALRLRAMHVHHGLQSDADGWQARCEDLCQRLDVPLEVVRLGLLPRRGESVEAEAREARYAALAERLAPGEALLTAHHEDDQAETVLLQLFRGAGVAGLAAMPSVATLGSGLHLRPLLGAGRAAIEAYAREAGLSWAEDPMNAEARFDRAFLRREVMPRLRARWPAVARSMARSAGHLAEARLLLAELARQDAAVVQDGSRLRVESLRRLSRPRQANLLRWWLAGRGLGMPSAARLASILDNVLEARPDAGPVVTWATGEVRRYRDLLYAMRPLRSPPADWRQSIVPGQAVDLPGGLGRVALVAAAGPAIAAEALTGPLWLRFRRGGERLRPVGDAHTRSLGGLCQAGGIPPWERARMPLLYSDGRLLAAGENWIEARCADPAGGFRLSRLD